MLKRRELLASGIGLGLLGSLSNRPALATSAREASKLVIGPTNLAKQVWPEAIEFITRMIPWLPPSTTLTICELSEDGSAFRDTSKKCRGMELDLGADAGEGRISFEMWEQVSPSEMIVQFIEASGPVTEHLTRWQIADPIGYHMDATWVPWYSQEAFTVWGDWWYSRGMAEFERRCSRTGRYRTIGRPDQQA